MNRIFTLLFLLLLCKNLSAQDTRFAQYEFTPLLTNPAVIAADDYMLASIDYRSEKINQDLTFKATSVNGKYPFYNKQGKRFLAVGIGFTSDKSEGLGNLNQFGFLSSLSYNHYLGETWAVSIGAGLSYARREFTLNDYTTGSQWVNNIGFVPDASNGETFQNLNSSYLSANAGIQLYQSDSHGEIKHYLGFSTFHINEPNQSFLESKEPKPMRYSVQAGVRAYEGNKFMVGPEAIFNNQAGSNAIGIGANFSYLLANKDPYSPIKNGSINLKIRNVVDKAVILGIQLIQPNFSIGFSYDLGLSSNNQNPAMNATEFGFTVKKRLSGKCKKPVKTVSNYSVNNIKEFYKKEDNNAAKNDGTTDEKSKSDQSDSNQTDDEGELQFELNREFGFGFNETVLDDGDKLYLDDLANLIKLNSHLEIEIIGHADNQGSESGNRKISQQRARVVEDYLIAKGVDKRRIKAVGKGSKDPLVPNDSEANRAKNRRVEFIIYKK